LGAKLPSLPTVVDVPINLESRILLLQNRLRELDEARQSPHDSQSKFVMYEAEAELIRHMIWHYRAVSEFEQRLKESSTDS
jgi:hypothetical protein